MRTPSLTAAATPSARLLLAAVIAVSSATAACGGGDRSDSGDARGDAPSASSSQGPDPIVLRVARTGGRVRAFTYPRLDSAVWTSGDAAPALGRILAFDEENGSIAAIDAKGQPARIELRSGGVSAPTKTKLVSLASADGYAIYGVVAGSVARYVPNGALWTWKSPVPAREVLPQRDGSLLVVGERAGRTLVWRVRPPDDDALDSAVIGAPVRAVRAAALGDRVYFTVDTGLVALRTRDLEPAPGVRLDRPARAVVTTPSGDRLYVVSDSSATLSVIDRYREGVAVEIAMPAPAGDVRMDPLGRYVLVRALRGDSAWVVAVGTNRKIGAVRTAWSVDLPFVAPDGQVALAQGADVVFVDGETLAVRRRVAGGTRDFWHVLFWNGFRPRKAGIDEPVTFRTADGSPGDTLDVSDSMDSAFAGGAVSPADTGASVATPGAVDSAPPPTPARPASSATAPKAAAPLGVWMVQFASLLQEDKARETANAIRVEGRTARVAPTRRGATTIYRVVVGPFVSKADADRAGRSANHDFWIYEGTQ